MSEEDHGCSVYIIAARTRDGVWGSPVKVGVAGNPRGRVAEIQTSCPHRIELYTQFQLFKRTYAMQLEADIHETLTYAWAHGEWFNVHPEEALHAAMISLSMTIEQWVIDEEIPLDRVEDIKVWTGYYQADKWLRGQRYISAWQEAA